MSRYWCIMVILLPGLLLSAGLAAGPDIELKVNSANLLINGAIQPPAPITGFFGPGTDAVTLVGSPIHKSQVRWSCQEVPEGDYYLGLLVSSRWYLGFSEFYPSMVHLYHNDRRVVWTSHTEPLKPENAGEQRQYQAEMRVDRPVHIAPGDGLRVVFSPDGDAIQVGPLRLYRTPPEGAVQTLNPPDWGKPRDLWLYGAWEEPQREGDTVRQSCWLHNPGTHPCTVTLDVLGLDYLQVELLRSQETVTIGPAETIRRTYELKPGQSGRARLTLTASSEGMFPDLRLVRFFADGVTSGPRPSACLNGEWEMCQLPGPEPGATPPADATWTKITVPSLQATTDGHCAWYRKRFVPPDHIRGERILLRFDQVLSEGWFYLNGQAVGHELHGSQPCEVDITTALRPGEPNEILVAVRDWIAYSPKNQQRVARGEAPIFKDAMLDVAGYNAAANLGLGGCVWLEARPAVSVDDVFVVTSVREKKLTLKYRLANTRPADHDVALRAQVLDAGQPVKVLPEAKLRVPGQGRAEVTVEAPWEDPKLWWPDDPHLYILQTDLQPTTGTPDRHLQRFGFRELWIDGISFILNGTRVKIRSQWASGASGVFQAAGQWDPAKRLEAIWSWQTRMVQDADHQLTRTHGQAGVKEACDIADEVGLMIKLESECNQTNFTFDQRFWNAVIDHELRVMNVYKNHPSVVMWSAGNENMWGWIYQGEAAKTLGNRWQIRVVQAMRRFDLMRRPIEWEADGDLMGGWEHYALHYPREMSQFPDLPNSAWWGPLDGKTVVPYSMGPITLGLKPLTVGEAFWPATLNRPMGASILLGDRPYVSSVEWARAWLDSSRFFINGFRDVEFALIDVYAPLALIKPQTVVIKQEDRAFYGGRTVHRDLNIHNDLRRPADLTLRWGITGASDAADRQFHWQTVNATAMRLAPAELKRMTVDIPLPAVRDPATAELRFELWDGQKLVHTATRQWRIYPPLAIRVPPGLALAVYDPPHDTAAMLDRVGVPFTRLTELKAPEGGVLIIGRDALKQPLPGPWRESLLAFVRGGGKLLIMEQSQAPDFLPIPLTQVQGKRSTMAYVRAQDHPVLAGLIDDDLRWWCDDHYVSAGNFRKPAQGNYLPLVDVGTSDGILETPLLEEYEGKGSILLCQMLLTDKVGLAPQADILLQNLLDYLASPRCFRSPGTTALIAGPDSALRKALDESQLVYTDATPQQLTPEQFQVAIVDVATGLDTAALEPLRAFAQAGGQVLLHRATPDKRSLVESLLGARLRLFPVAEESSDVGNHVARISSSGLLAGVSNHDLYWATKAYLACVQHEGGWWSYYDHGCPPAEMIAEYFCAPGDDVPAARMTKLTRPGTLLQVPCGQGRIILSQLRLDEPLAETAVTITRLRSFLFTNLGCTLRSPGGAALARKQRLQEYEFFTVDLAPYVNRGLTENKEAGIVAWTNQGENDMRALPTGRQVFEGIPFMINSPKGAVVLYSPAANNTDLPKEVTGIKVGRRADVLFFLHTAAWCNDQPFTYRIHYEDGTTVELPIRAGQQVIDWWQDPAQFAEAMTRHGMFVAWRGDNPMRRGVVLPGYEWVNPHPEKVIRDIDFVANAELDYSAVPVLVAITGAVSQPKQGVVTDVLGTHGAKVLLGTQEVEVLYIGVAGIPPDHPYYEQAVATHRNLVVGKKVTLVDDVVTRNAAGQRLAYVYLGDIFDINSLVNAKIIGDGLGKLGNFEGNDRQRMYLENLGFIAQQRKVGMWGTAQ